MQSANEANKCYEATAGFIYLGAGAKKDGYNKWCRPLPASLLLTVWSLVLQPPLPSQWLRHGIIPALGAHDKLFSISEWSHTTNQFSKAKKGWLGWKLPTQEHGSHAAHMVSTIPCLAAGGSGLKSWGFSYRCPPYSYVWWLCAKLCFSFAVSGSFLQTLASAKKPWRCMWRPQRAGSFHPSQVPTAPGKPKHPYIAQSKDTTRMTWLLFLSVLHVKKQTDTLQMVAEISGAKYPSMNPGDWQSRRCLAGAADAVGTQDFR